MFFSCCVECPNVEAPTRLRKSVNRLETVTAALSLRPAFSTLRQMIAVLFPPTRKMHAHGLRRREFLLLLTDLIAFVINILDEHKFLVVANSLRNTLLVNDLRNFRSFLCTPRHGHIHGPLHCALLQALLTDG